MQVLNERYVVTTWTKVHRDKAPIILEVIPDPERISGGYYTRGPGSYFYEIRALNMVGKGASRMRSSASGMKYHGSDEFFVPYMEIERLNLPGVLQPSSKFYMEPFVFQTINANPLPRPRLYRVQAMRTRDSYPTFSKTFTFDDDTPAQAPSSWTLVDPSESSPPLSSVYSGGNGNVVRCEGGVYADGHSYVYADITKFIKASAITIEFDVTIDAIDLDDEGIVAMQYVSGSPPPLLDITDMVFHGVVYSEGDGSTMYYRDIDNDIVNVEVEEGVEFHVKVVIDRIEGKIHGTVNSVDFEKVMSSIEHANYITLSNYKDDVDGSPGIVDVDNLEVDCLHAL